MSYAYTTDELISQIKRRGMIASTSSSTNTLSTTDLLSFINDEIQTFMVPLIMSTREEFFVTYADQTIAAGTSAYEIPPRAIGAKLKNVTVLNGSDYVPLERIEPEAITRSPTTANGPPEGYYLQGNSVVLWPTPSVSGTLRLYYFIRPNRCVVAADCSAITTVGSTTVVVSTVGTNFGTSAAYYDFVKYKGAFECRAIDQSGTRSTTTLTFSGGVPSNVVVGDYVALAGESPFPQIPIELHPLLAQRVVVRALEATSDPSVPIHVAEADRMKQAALTMLTPRSEGSSRYVINRNAPGFGRWTRFWR